MTRRMENCDVCDGNTWVGDADCEACAGQGIITQAALSERTTEAAEAAYELQLTGDI